MDDVLAWCLLAFVSALVKADGDHLALLRVGALSLCYVALMLFAVRPLLARLVRLPAALADRRRCSPRCARVSSCPRG